MAPLLRPRASLPKDKFASYFAPLQSQFYVSNTTGRGAPTSIVRTIAWNPLGNLVATGSSDKTLRVCECLLQSPGYLQPSLTTDKGIRKSQMRASQPSSRDMLLPFKRWHLTL